MLNELLDRAVVALNVGSNPSVEFYVHVFTKSIYIEIQASCQDPKAKKATAVNYIFICPFLPAPFGGLHALLQPLVVEPLTHGAGMSISLREAIHTCLCTRTSHATSKLHASL